MDGTKYIMVITTCASQAEASRLASELIGKKLAACVQACHITSTYRWRGVIEMSDEVRLTIKARSADYEGIEALIKSRHSYQNPEVLAVPVTEGSQAYLDWIDAQTART